jgi:hypothetical protein
MQPPGPRYHRHPMKDAGPTDEPGPTQANPPRPPAAECILGETLCRVRVLSEAEWAALPPDRRPRAAEHFPGLGWVVAVAGRDD